jgi:tetratricopeptide (TPR) repeat protein
MSSKRKRPTNPIDAPEEHVDDKFVAGVLEATNWAEKNRSALIAGVLALLFVVVSTVYYVNNRRSVDVRATTELERIHQSAGVGDPAATLTQLNEYVQRYDGTRQEAEARVLLGQLNLEAGNAEAAVQALAPLLPDVKDPVAIQGVSLLGVAYEQAGRDEDAVDAYMAVADAATMTFQSRESALAAARVLSEAGEFARAAQVYEELLLEFDEDTPGRGALELRLAEVTAKM